MTMRLSLRHRILLTVLPHLVLIAVVGVAGVVLLGRLGGRADAILRENYYSVIYMVDLNEALEWIVRSLQFALAGPPDAKDQYDANWQRFRDNLEWELNNITLPGERELADRLAELADAYRAAGDRFYEQTPPDRRRAAYFGTPNGLFQQFEQIKKVSGQIRLLNQENMKEAASDARATAAASRVWLAVGLVVATLLAGLMVWHTARSLLRPIREVTRAAQSIGAGNLDRVVPVP